MSTYQKVWLIAFMSIAGTIGGLLVYGRIISDDWQDVARALRELAPSKVTEIRILPKHPDYPINLTLDPIIVKASDQIEVIVSNLKEFESAAHEKIPERYWEMVLVLEILNPEELDLKNKENIVLKFKNIDSGLYFEMSGVMGYQTFLCTPELRQIFEGIASFKAPLGGNR